MLLHLSEEEQATWSVATLITFFITTEIIDNLLMRLRESFDEIREVHMQVNQILLPQNGIQVLGPMLGEHALE